MTDSNIEHRTSVISAYRLHIGHRIAIRPRYRFGGRRHLAAPRVNSACLLTRYCWTVDRVKQASECGVRLISVRDISYVRRQRSVRRRHEWGGV